MQAFLKHNKVETDIHEVASGRYFNGKRMKKAAIAVNDCNNGGLLNVHACGCDR